MGVHNLNKRRADRDFPVFVPSGSRSVPTVIYVVLDEDSRPIYSHTDRGSAHHWINAAISAEEDGTSVARHWVVREYRVAPHGA